MHIEIYSHPNCRYCHLAKALLYARGLVYREIDVSHDQLRLEEMVKRTGGKSFPQIVIDGKAIGGYEQLRHLLKASA